MLVPWWDAGHRGLGVGGGIWVAAGGAAAGDLVVALLASNAAAHIGQDAVRVLPIAMQVPLGPDPASKPWSGTKAKHGQRSAAQQETSGCCHGMSQVLTQQRD